MPTFEIISLIVLTAVLWLWFDSVQARGIAVQEAERICALEDFQFLDETVAIASLKPARDDEGRLVLSRTYAFEYSDTGNNRRPGSIVMLGKEVLAVNVGLRIVSGAEIR